MSAAKRAKPARKEYERNRIRDRAEYDHAYARRPYVKERERQRSRARVLYDPGQQGRRLVQHSDVVLPEPYSQHPWLRAAMEATGGLSDSSGWWADDRLDEAGEALLALLEGRGMAEAIVAYRKAEYVSRHRTVRIGDWRGEDNEGEDLWIDKVMPAVPSAEDEYLTREASTPYNMVWARYKDVATRHKQMKHRSGQPSNRRQNNP